MVGKWEMEEEEEGVIGSLINKTGRPWLAVSLHRPCDVRDIVKKVGHLDVFKCFCSAGMLLSNSSRVG